MTEPTVEEAMEMLARDRASWKLETPPPPQVPETVVQHALWTLASDRVKFALTADIRNGARIETAKPTPGRR